MSQLTFERISRKTMIRHETAYSHFLFFPFVSVTQTQQELLLSMRHRNNTLGIDPSAVFASVFLDFANVLDFLDLAENAPTFKYGV